MSSCKVIAVSSCKGGVGKSTVAANLGLALTKRGRRVLLVDLDLGMRCLDLILGLEDRAVYDIQDVVHNGVPLKRSIVQSDQSERLYFCAAPFQAEVHFDTQRFQEAVCKEAQALGFDYLFLDTPGDMGHPFVLACSLCEMALVVATHGPTAIRAAERTGQAAADRGVRQSLLVINNFDIRDKKHIAAGERAGVLDIIDKTYLPLLGVVPYDENFARAQEQGALVSALPGTNVAAAFDNMAARIEGQATVLFHNFKKISRKKLV